jgi:two-component system OmpR family sensor kinase
VQYSLQKELFYAKLSDQANKISSKITYAQMMGGGRLDFKELKTKEGFRFALFDKNQNVIISHIDHKIDFSKKYYKDKEGHLGVVDTSSFGHMGVYFVVVEESSFLQIINRLKLKLALVFLVIFSVLSIVGYLLSRLFIKPIQDERAKLDRFIKDSTHELNTPITALLMSTSSSNPTSEKNLERIRLSAIRISKIYEDLTYSLINSQKDENITQVWMDEVLKDQLKTLKPFADKKSITIDTDIEKFSYYIDKESAIRLFSNLISNAIKYTNPNGKIKITLKNCTFIIEDNGIGISKEKLRAIFERFYRATNTEGGFGIGLSIVYDICKKYGISVEVDSVPQKGSRFGLRF